MSARCARCACLLALAASPSPAADGVSARDYPNRPVRFIVGLAPGGATDIVARGLAQKVSEILGQPVVVENRAGAAGSIGAALTAKALPDGYTALVVSSTYAINPGLYKSLPYDPNRDLQPVTLIASSPFLLMAHPALPVRTVKELIALAKAKPKQLNYGSGGIGNSGHLAAELFSSMANVEFIHVPYKGAGPALTDLLGGQIQLLFNSIISGLPHAKSGRLTALAITSAKRSSAAPDLPTVAESGVPGYEFSSWYGLLVPTGTPRTVISKLNAGVVSALAQPDYRDRLSKDGSDPVGSSPEQFGSYLKSEMAKLAKVVKSSGMQAE